MNKKSDQVYALAKGMQQRGVPIDGVGLQSRAGALRVAEYPFVWGKGGTKRVLESGRLAMGFANVGASRYGIR